MTPMLILAGPASGCGKTTLTCGIAAALRQRGLVVRCFKAGPDYLDPTHHEHASGAPSRNLDRWMMGEAGVARALAAGCAGADIALVEGMMGLFDGRSPDSLDGSAAELAAWLDVPVVAVVDASAMARTAAAVVEGLAGHAPGVRVAGAIFNRVGGSGHGALLAQALAGRRGPHGPLAALGWLAEDPALAMPERHLGLVAARTPDPARLERLAAAVSESIDLDALLAMARPARALPPTPTLRRGPPVRIGLAWDAAFDFVYQDNLDLLHQAGAQVVPFSPLDDAALPDDLGGLILPGGYPEAHAQALSDNRAMRSAIRTFCATGKPVIAECGGFMYLGRSLECAGTTHEMCGVFDHTTRAADRVRTLGYRQVHTTAPSPLGPSGMVVRGHEFHASELVSPPTDATPVFRWTGWRGEGVDGWCRGGTVGGWLHLHWGRAPHMAAAFAAACRGQETTARAAAPSATAAEPSLAPVLCVFGTASDVGKSWITTGLCRIFHQDGIDVAPYKAQNMSNNAAVTPQGLEMGRAQVVQAEACRLAPHVDMNPLLLKPNTDTGAQVVLLGKVVGDMEARAYFSGGMDARRAVVLAALDRLRARHQRVVAEGAGSCAEVNLRDRDLVNFPVAHHADAPVLLVADIHRGGVFAQVLGSLLAMPAADRARVQGVIVNRFRGDPRLFDDGVDWLQRHAGVPVLGVVPWTQAVRIESEDGLAADAVVDGPAPQQDGRVHIAVLRLPHIANFTDFDALERLGVGVHYLAEPRDLGAYDAVVLPGTKNTRGDLAWLRSLGWDRRLVAHARDGGHLWGLCGGYQLLGARIDDPHGVEGEPGSCAGLGLLPVATTMAPTKRTTRTTGQLAGGERVEGYEIHMGQTQAIDAAVPLVQLTSRDGQPTGGTDGTRSPDGRVWGTYLHGLFDRTDAARALLAGVRPDLDWADGVQEHDAWRQEQFDGLAAHLRSCLDFQAIGAMFD